MDKKHAGLKNFGFNCFINTTLQCLQNSSSIYNELYSNDDVDSIILEKLKNYTQNKEQEHILKTNNFNKKIDDKLFSLLKVYFTFKKLIINVKTQKETQCPGDFILACKEVSNFKYMEHLFNGSQNDVQEFLTFLLDSLHDAKSFYKKIIVPEQEDNINDIIKNKAITVFKTHF